MQFTRTVNYTYFKKGCFSDACFLDRSASCLLNLWLLLSSYHRTCSRKTRANVYFFMFWFSPGVPLARKAINAFIYSKHDALRSMKQGHASCITEATLFEIGAYNLIRELRTRKRAIK